MEYEGLINSGRVETSRAVYSDKKSLEVFDNFITFFSNKSEDLLAIKSDPIGHQYFPKDLQIPRDASRFINAGAFDGDTLLSMKKNEIAKSDVIACFEPDLGNFRKLAALANSSTGKKISKQYYLFFCGLGSTISVTKFNAGALVNSSVDSSGHSTIPIVTLDAALPYFRPTFITMDIEGSEYDAIVGARDMIRQSTPDLAIAIYHSIEQFLTIPLLIKSFKVGYRFYLRNYTGFPAESILYATTRP